MSLLLHQTQESLQHPMPNRSMRRLLRRGLLACGIAYPLVYAVANDLIAASRYPGYGRMSQTISELSATGAPTRPFLTAMLPVFSGLVTAFGVGVWFSANGKRTLRVSGGLLVASGLTGLLWLLAPMSRREVLAAGGGTSGDTFHMVLSGWTGVLVLSLLGFGAAAFGKRFRLYSLVTAATVVVSAVLMVMWSPNMTAGEPTPWLGLVERINMGAWYLWMAVFAIALLRREATSALGGIAEGNKAEEIGAHRAAQTTPTNL